MRVLNRAYFFYAVIGVLMSGVVQYAILSNMRHNTAMEQAVVLFYADITLVLLVDKFKRKHHQKQCQNN